MQVGGELKHIVLDGFGAEYGSLPKVQAIPIGDVVHRMKTSHAAVEAFKKKMAGMKCPLDVGAAREEYRATMTAFTEALADTERYLVSIEEIKADVAAVKTKSQEDWQSERNRSITFLKSSYGAPGPASIMKAVADYLMAILHAEAEHLEVVRGNVKELTDAAWVHDLQLFMPAGPDDHTGLARVTCSIHMHHDDILAKSR